MAITRNIPSTPLRFEPDASIDRLTLANRRTRFHPPEQKAQIEASLQTFGIAKPILACEHTGVILDGEAVFEVARDAGVRTVAVIWVGGKLSPAKLGALRIALNKIGDLGAFDPDALRDAVSEALALDIDSKALGFDPAELDAVLSYPGTEVEDETIAAPVEEPIVQRGDLFTMDAHRLLCGDALDAADCALLMGGEQAGMVITDPPFNIQVNGFVSTHKAGRTRREFPMASGEMSKEEFRSFLRKVLAQAAGLSRDGAILDFFIDWRSVAAMIDEAENSGLDLIALCVWGKHAAGMGSLYRSQHELVCVFRKPGAPHVNNIMLGKNGRYRTNLWLCEGRAGFGEARAEDLSRHPTPKPVKMIADAILDTSRRGDIVLDLFAGGGPCAIAAQETGRKARLMELDPGYAEGSLIRYRERFGVEPVHIQSGLTLTELSAERRREAEVGTSLPDAERGRSGKFPKRHRQRRRPSQPASVGPR